MVWGIYFPGTATERYN
uniref:Uncharacterized protein n=1 Tax=Anguilla anguilla TaxID=7936 RepID=A0A0E9UL66_ANGAN